jgi:adenylate cyclase
MDRAAYEAAGLLDVDAAGADGRLELLEWMAARGITIDQMVVAHAHGQLVSLAGDLLRAGDVTRLTVAEMAARSGTDAELVSRLWQSAGFHPPAPDARVFHPDDVVLFQEFAAATELFGTERTLHFVRVMGASLARIAESANSLFLVNVETPMLEQAAPERELAEVQVQALEASRALPRAMDVFFRYQMDEAIRRSRVVRGSASLEAEQTLMTVAFVDVVDFTRVVQELSTRELATVVAEFEAAASDIVSARDARLVKVIGDEVMYVALDPADACEIALDLCRLADEHPTLAAARGGVARGPLISQDGDYYGALVNMAARAVNLADPGTVLVTDDVRRASDDMRLRFVPAGRRELRGFEEPVPLFTVTSV